MKPTQEQIMTTFLHERITPHQADSYEVGAILVGSWGYDQTNIEFFCIIDRRLQGCDPWLTLQPMSQTMTERTGDMSENVAPNVMDENAKSIRRKLVAAEGEGEIGCKFQPSYGWIKLWDGRPRHQSHWA